jgi:hypothetical protein
VEQPTDVDGQLMSLRTREQGTEGQGVKEPGLVDPASPLDQLLAHQGYLAGRAAEVDEPEEGPEPHGLGEARADPAEVWVHARILGRISGQALS